MFQNRLGRFKRGLSLFLVALLSILLPSYWVPTATLAVLPPQLILNQVGYGPDWQKRAFFLNPPVADSQLPSVAVIQADSGQTVLTVPPQAQIQTDTAGNRLAMFDFSRLTDAGTYILKSGVLESVPFRIGLDIYPDVLKPLLRSYTLQRCGVVLNDPVTGLHHAPCHLHDGAIAHSDNTDREGQVLPAAGGWHDAGDYGKYVATATVTIGQLLNLYAQNPQQFQDSQLQIPESGNNIPDLLDEMQVGLDWLLSMQRPDGAVYRKLSGKQWPIGLAPDEDRQTRYVYGVSTPETAKFAATMAMASRIYAPVLPQRATVYRAAALAAWQFLQTQPEMITHWVDGDDSGSGKYLYSDIDNEASLTTDLDDRLWAAAELWITTGQTPFERYFNEHVTAMDYTLFEWKDPSSLGLLDYLLQTGDRRNPKIAKKIRTKLLTRAERLLTEVQHHPYGLANQRFIWGSNKMTLEEGITLAYAYRLTQDRRYLDAARDQLHFILGRNPFNQTFVTGVGRHPVQHINHLFARAKRVAIPGLLVGGPNNGAQDGIAPKNQGVFSYSDHEQSYATNEYAIDYNAALVALIGLTVSNGA